MKNLQELAALAKAAKENLETAIIENICEEINVLLKQGVSPEIAYTLNLLMINQQLWGVSQNEYGIGCILPLEKLENAASDAAQLVAASEAAIGFKKEGITYFVDERFGIFMICYTLGKKITVQYSQHSGYGETAVLSVQFQIMENSQVLFVCIQDSFTSSDPVIKLPPCPHPEKMLTWIMEGFKK